jgi:phage/conjugal plasmid C-4 type zinc finger TraR family protein
MKFIALHSRGGNYLVVASNVAWLRAAENGQTQIGIVGGQPLLVAGSMEEISAQLMVDNEPSGWGDGLRLFYWRNYIAICKLPTITPGLHRPTQKGSIMAGGWTRDGAVQDQIDDSVKDAVAGARARMPAGPSAEYCDDCGEPIAERRRAALPGVRTCINCQSTRDKAVSHSQINRRGSKDSQLRWRNNKK